MANNRGPASHSSRKPPRKADGEFKKLFISERKKKKFTKERTARTCKIDKRNFLGKCWIVNKITARRKKLYTLRCRCQKERRKRFQAVINHKMFEFASPGPLAPWIIHFPSLHRLYQMNFYDFLCARFPPHHHLLNYKLIFMIHHVWTFMLMHERSINFSRQASRFFTRRQRGAEAKVKRKLLNTI